MSINWSDFVDIIDSHQNFLLTSHIRPDCDALGSELGMAGVLEARGKSVWIVNGQKTPPNFTFLDPQQRIQAIGDSIQLEDLQHIEVLMVLDTSAWAQLGPMGDVLRATQAKKIILDHHVSADDLGAEAFKDTRAEATGRLVVEAAEQLQVALTPQIATPLFAAIATDTGWFRFGSTGSVTYRTAAKLVDAGAQPAAIYQHLYERDSLERVRLRGTVLARIVTELQGRLAYTYIQKSDFEETGARPSDTEDLINLALEIEGTEVAVIFVEQQTGGFKLSFRSRCDLDCSKIAECFDGGGHKAAAGAFLLGQLDDVREKVLDVVRAAME